MAITDKEQGVWELDQVYNKINQGGIWIYTDPAGIYVWGRNESSAGALGLNDTDDRSSPTQLGGYGWNSVANNTGGGLATKTNGTLWSWGYNGFGQLGLNQPHSTHISSPTQIPGTTWAKAHVRTQGGQSFATKTDGSLWGFGDNTRGGLGDNTDVRRSSPVQIPGTWANCTIVGGDGQMLARKSNGTIWSWGYGQAGNLGLNKGSESGNLKISSPTQIGTDATWSGVGQGYYRGFGTKTDGTLWGWGGGGVVLQQGNNTNYSSPVQIGTDTDWGGKVEGYRYGALAIKSNGKLYGWGEQDNSDRAGCLGQNDLADVPAPTLIGTETTWHDVTLGVPGCANGLKTDGTLWSWGGYVYGGTGLNLTGSASQRSSPTQIPGTWNALSGASIGSQNQMGIKGAAPG